MKNLILLFMVLSIGSYAQTRKATVTVDGNSYDLYTSPDSYGGTLYDFRGSGRVLEAPAIPNNIPLAPVTNTYWSPEIDHFRDSMTVDGIARTSWELFSQWYKNQDDPKYRKDIITICKTRKWISKTYKE